jgi:hypothetical protein
MTYRRLRLTDWKQVIALGLAGAADREHRPDVGPIQVRSLFAAWDLDETELESALTELIDFGLVVLDGEHGILSLTLPPSAPEGPLEALQLAVTQAAFHRALPKPEGTVLLGLLDSATLGEVTRRELYAKSGQRCVEAGIARLVARGWIEDDGERCRLVPLEEYCW